MHALIRILARLFFRLAYGVTVRGGMRAHERLLIIANHQSFLDGALLGAFLPVTPMWLVHTTIAARWYFRLPLKLFPHLVIDTRNPMALKTIVGLVESGKPVMIFPEGRITVSGGLMKIYDGPAFVAAKTGAAVVPVHISGALHTPFSRMGQAVPRKLFPRIRLTIHPEQTIRMPESGRPRDRRRAAAEQMRRIMQLAAFESRERKTIPEAFLDALQLHGRGAPLMEDIRYEQASYGGTLRMALALGRMAAKFTAEGENVGVLMPNANATAGLILGLLVVRRVPAMMNHTTGAEGMMSACRAAGVKSIVTSRAFIERARLAPVMEKMRGVRIVYLEDLRPAFGALDKLWLMAWALRFPRRVVRPSSPGDPAVILFTSGSEGKPKGVVLSHDAILANIEQLICAIDVTPRDKILSVLPLFHAFGLTVGCILPLVTGVRVFLYPSPLHYRIVPEMVYDRDCTVLFATNTFLAHYARFAHPYDLRTIRILGAGAEKLTEDVRRLYMDKFGVRVIEGYGATECAPVISINAPLGHRTGTVGEIVPGMEARVEPVPGIGEGGILHVRGPNLMLGYLREDRPGVVQPLGGDGWYNTGDVVSLDGHFVTILGRVRRFAKVAGEMISLDLVEKIAAAAAPNALHAAAAAVQHGRGEMVVLYTQDPGLRRDVLQHAARELGAPEIALPRRIVHLEKIPILGNGKKDYVTLNRMAAELAEQSGVRV